MIWLLYLFTENLTRLVFIAAEVGKYRNRLLVLERAGRNPVCPQVVFLV